MIIDEPEAQVIYLAGIIDGEGHICKYPTTRRREGVKDWHGFAKRIIITNTNLKLMEWLIDNFGGSYHATKKQSERHAQCYVWQLTGDNAIELGKRLKPYLIVKQEQLLKILN